LEYKELPKEALIEINKVRRQFDRFCDQFFALRFAFLKSSSGALPRVWACSFCP
jgi:hypothetical protein